MNKVYIVTSGEYSDYCINGVFASYEEAKNYLKRHDYSFEDSNIEEWMLGGDYLGKLYWEVEVMANCTSSLNIIKIWAEAEETSGLSIIQRTGTRWFVGSSLSDMPVLDLMMIVPRNRFATKQEVEDHYKKVMQDYVAKIKYMMQVEGNSIYEAVDLINDQLFYDEKEDV